MEKEEKQFYDYLDRCSRGALLAKGICLEGSTTHYMIMNSDMGATIRNLKILSAFRYYYSGAFPYHFDDEEHNVAPKQFPNRTIVKKIVVIVNEALRPVVELCSEVDEIVIKTDFEIACLDDYARTPHSVFPFLYPNEPKKDYLFTTMFHVSSYITQLKIPKKIVNEHRSQLVLSEGCLYDAKDYMKKHNIDPGNTVIIVPDSENKAFSIDHTYWDSLLSHLSEKKKNIYTYTTKNDSILANSEKLDVPILLLLGLIYHGCNCVSVQSTTAELIRNLDSPYLNILVVFYVQEVFTEQLAKNRNLHQEITTFRNMRYLKTSDAESNTLPQNILKQYILTFEQVFDTQFQDYEKGFLLAQKYCDPNPNIHYLIQNRHVGDSMRNLKILKAFKNYYSGSETLHFQEEYFGGKDVPTFRRDRIVEKVVIVTTSLLSGVARLCEDVDEIIVLTKDELYSLDKYSMLQSKMHQNLHPDELNGYLNHYLFLMYGTGCLSQQMMAPPESVRRFASDFSVSEKSLDEAQKFLETLNMPTNKILILVSFARSSPSLAQNELQKLIDYSKKNGDQVFTNCGPHEEPLEGTDRLYVSVDIFAALIKLGCKVVGVQCGLVDVIVWLDDPTLEALVVHKLTTHSARQFAINRGITQQIVEKGKFTHIKHEPTDKEPLDELILQQFKRKYEKE